MVNYLNKIWVLDQEFLKGLNVRAKVISLRTKHEKKKKMES